MTRREHARILGDVLDNLARVTAGDPLQPRANLTGLAARANLPHDRLQEYLSELRSLSLVTDDHLPTLTPRGDQFLACYRAWVRVQVLYGLSEPLVGQEGVVLLRAAPAPNDTYGSLKPADTGRPL